MGNKNTDVVVQSNHDTTRFQHHSCTCSIDIAYPSSMQGVYQYNVQWMPYDAIVLVQSWLAVSGNS